MYFVRTGFKLLAAAMRAQVSGMELVARAAERTVSLSHENGAALRQLAPVAETAAEVWGCAWTWA